MAALISFPTSGFVTFVDECSAAYTVEPFDVRIEPEPCVLLAPVVNTDNPRRPAVIWIERNDQYANAHTFRPIYFARPGNQRRPHTPDRHGRRFHCRSSPRNLAPY